LIALDVDLLISKDALTSTTNGKLVNVRGRASACAELLGRFGKEELMNRIECHIHVADHY
jgi:hypothetical protein